MNQKLNFMQVLRQFTNTAPEQRTDFVKGILEQQAQANNPLAQNLLNMMNSPDPQNMIINFAQNFCKEKGVDFNSSFNDFQQNFLK